jgi:hypothetical protein
MIVRDATDTTAHPPALASTQIHIAFLGALERSMRATNCQRNVSMTLRHYLS